MVKIYVVDNGGQWTHREWRVLRYLNVETKIIPNTTKIEDIDADALVLSGGAPRIGWESQKLGECGSYVDNLNIPILAICVGHQFLAMHFGGEVGPSKVPEFGKTEIKIVKDSRLFEGLPKKLMVWESHNDEIKKLPGEFSNLASSENCKIQAIEHKKRPIFGLQFHPEVEQTEYGYEIFKNFIKLVKK